MRNLLTPPFHRVLLELPRLPARMRTEERVGLPSGKRHGVCLRQFTKSDAHFATIDHARKGTVFGATPHQSGRNSFEHAGRTQVLAVAPLQTDLEENQNRDHAR